MKLIGTWLSPYASRILIAARFKGIELSVVEPGEAGAPPLAELTPIGKVPVLLDADLVLPESQVILEYLEECIPEPTLFPGNAAQRANIRLLVRLNDTYSAASFGPFLSGDRAAVTEALARIGTALGYIDHFRIDGLHASGNAFSAADCALIPFFHIIERLQGGFGAFGLVRRHPKLEAWWSRASESEIGTHARRAIDEAITRRLGGG